MLPLLFLVTSALSSSMAAPYHQEGIKSVNDAPASVSDTVYYVPSRREQSSANWDDESHERFALFERPDNQVHLKNFIILV